MRSRNSRLFGRPGWRLLLAATLLELAACAPDRSTAPGSLKRPTNISRDVGADATEQLLYNQPPLVGTNLFTGGTTSGDVAAVDFVVPPGGHWKLGRVVVVGQGFDSSDPDVGLFQINIYKDNGSGQPGDAVISGISRVPTAVPDPCCGGAVFDYSRNFFEVDLAPGRYWITNRLQSGSLRTFNPQLAAAVGYPGLFGQRFPSSWTVVSGAPNNDFAFSIYGTLESPAAAAANLQTTIEGFGLPAGTLTSLTAKLNAAQSALDAGDKTGACNALQDLINATSAQSGKKLTEAQAKTIIDEATRIRQIIGC